jgi:hypothetical protein
MKGVLGVWLLMLLMPSAYAYDLPGDSAEGKRLYDANCMGCHDTGIHIRKDRIVQSLDALKSGWATVVIWQEKNSPRLKRRTSSST